MDGKKKYCQVKAGPNTINKDDVITIDNHFNSIKNIARTNNLNIGLNDLIIGVLYGIENELSAHYKKLNSTYHYPVIIGKEFWHRLTGDEDFYLDLIDAFSEESRETDAREVLDNTIMELAADIRQARILIG